MTDLEKFLEGLEAAAVRLGLKGFGTMESMEKMDKLDSTRYDVVLIPRRPRPKDEAPKG